MTHINAYYGDVEAAKEAVSIANGKLVEAEAALKAHPDYQEPVVTESVPEKKPVKKPVKKPIKSATKKK